MNALRKLFSDRFVLFLVLGAGLFVVDRHVESEREGFEITIGAQDIAMLEGRWRAQSGVAPSRAELDALLDFHIEEEILVREARRLGLDQDDVILRRRLAQKMELLIRDGSAEVESIEDEVVSYFATHRESYLEPKRVGFRHVFLGSETDSNSLDVAGMLDALAREPDSPAWRGFGRAFILAREYGPRSHAELAELFGAAFADRLMDEPGKGGWWGPVRSSYGLHLVQVAVVEPARAPAFDEIAGQVAADLREAKLRDATEASRRALRSRYRVKLDLPEQ